MKEFQEKSETEIVSILKNKVEASDSYNQSELALQRQDSMNMYYLNPLGNEIEGTSTIQSSEVFDAVEGTKSVIIEALTAGRELIHFEPLDENDVDLAKMANRYVRDRFQENNGYRFMMDSLHDGLLAKNAVAKYYWVEDKEERIEPFMGIDQMQYQGALQDPSIEVYEVSEMQGIDPQGMPVSIFSGAFIRTTDKSHVGFKLVKPEDFFGDETAETDEDFTFASDREVLRKGELIEDYPHLEKEIRGATAYDDSRREQDNLTRHSNDSTWRTTAQDEKASEREPVEVHNCYIQLWGKEGYGTYQFRMLAERYLLWEWPTDEDGNDLAELPEDFNPAVGELVDEFPYLTWSPYPLSHRWDGLSQADGVRDIQIASTSLKRSMINHTLRTNNPMREANLDHVRNPQDLIDNVIGAIIDKESSAGMGPVVTSIDQPQMSMAAFQTLEMVKQESEQRSSYSRVAGGLNQQALSNQNSTDMVQLMTNGSNRRIMMMTRTYVELFMKRLYLKVYQLGVQNDKNQYKVELNGNWVDMSPSDWPMRPDMRVVNSMTPEAAIGSAMAKIQIHQLLSADPDAMLMYPDKKKFNMYSEILRELGELDIDRYIENPESEEYKAAQNAMLQGQQEQAQRQAEMAQEAKHYQERQIKILEMQTQAGIDQGQQKLDNDALKSADAQSLDEDEFEHQQDKDAAEIILETRKIEENKTVSGVSIGG